MSDTPHYNLEEGTRIAYRVTFRIGEPRYEDREGVIEGRDTFNPSPGSLDSHRYVRTTDSYLVRCTSCDHHRIDIVHPLQITEARNNRPTNQHQPMEKLEILKHDEQIYSCFMVEHCQDRVWRPITINPNHDTLAGAEKALAVVHQSGLAESINDKRIVSHTMTVVATAKGRRRPFSPWHSFFFESNQFFDHINGLYDWDRLRAAYPDKTEDELLDAREATYGGSRTREEMDARPNFGLRWEHDGERTLRDFFKEFGMKLPDRKDPPVILNPPTDEQ